MLCFSSYMYQNFIWKSKGILIITKWFPVVSLFLFYACSTIGYLIVPWVMIGEAFPRQIRGMMGGISLCIAHFSIFIVLQVYPFLQLLVTKPGTFTLFGIISILNTLFIYYFCPETKGKTLLEIEECFGKKKKTEI